MMTARTQNPLLPQHPFAMQASGPSGSGKTVWVKDLLTHQDSPFDKVIYYYSIWQPLYDEMRAALGDTIKFIEGLPEEAPLFDTALTKCFVFDDLMDEVNKSPWASKLYTAGCHHQNLVSWDYNSGSLQTANSGSSVIISAFSIILRIVEPSNHWLGSSVQVRLRSFVVCIAMPPPLIMGGFLSI